MAELNKSSTMIYGLGLIVYGVTKLAQGGLQFSRLAVVIAGALLVAYGAFSWATGRAGIRLSIGVPLSIIGFAAAVTLGIQFAVGEVSHVSWLVLGLILLSVLLLYYPLGRQSPPTKHEAPPSTNAKAL